jgi:hypothetical protein
MQTPARTPATAGAPSVIGGAGASSTAVAAGSGTGPANAGKSGSLASAGSSGNLASAGGGGLASAGSGAAGSAAGAAANSGMASVNDCGAGATVGKDKKNATRPSGTGRHATGSIDFKAKAGNRFLRLQTTLEVPPRPNGNSTLFMWPGLEPLENVSMNFEPIARGVLQPVLTWGGSCAPGSPPTSANYWISAQYVNTYSRQREFSGCFGGKVMDVKVGDKLYIDMRLKEGTTTWSQTVTNLSNSKTVDFDFDLKGQDQNWALFEIEVASSTLPASDVIFTDTVLTLATSEPEACQPDSFGPNDYYSAPLISTDGVKCCFERMVLREDGVPPTTKDP